MNDYGYNTYNSPTKKRLIERANGKCIWSTGCPAEDARHLAELVRENAITPEGVATWLDFIAETIDLERAITLDDFELPGRAQ